MPQKNSQRSAPWAVVLLSGGLDSATAAAWAQARGFRVAALTVRYGQRHAAELAAARRIARSLKLEKHLEIGVELSRIGGSALTDLNLKVPKNRSAKAISTGIPITYVPARNTVFLSLALGLAETLGAQDLVLGVNVLDYSGYPDCRPEFVRAFRRLADLATKAGVEKTARFRIHTPLIRKTKAQIVRLGTRLGVDYALTTSCYAPVTRGKRVFACGRCDSCLLRLKGFAEAGRTDPVPYGA
ncbi:MAG: 7-cyano-7-deazaguanine synthase [Planctomycetota bacterium]